MAAALATSLKIATCEPVRDQFFRIVHGAIRNTRHAHPEYKIGSTASISIAKRASGLLSAYWRERVPAEPADSGDGALRSSLPVRSGPSARWGRGDSAMPRPLRRLRQEISRQMATLKHTEDENYVRAMIDVLRMIARLENRDGRNSS